MSIQNPRSKMVCGLCGQLFHEPDMAAVPNYGFSRTTVSDAHRLMFHSSQEGRLNYDPEYLEASRRAEEVLHRNADQEWSAYLRRIDRLGEIAPANIPRQARRRPWWAQKEPNDAD